MEPDYTNREIREFIKEIRETLTRIESQTVKTNGRVSKLENWRSYTMGALAMISLFIVPLLVWSLHQIIALS